MTSTCAICCDVFKEPRFLSCAHTFCESCLDSYTQSSSTKTHIICPLCRTKTLIPQQGACALFENYFAARIRTSAKISTCEFCGEVERLKNCSHCDVEMCGKCTRTHDLVMNLGENREERPVFSATAPPSTSYVRTYYHVTLLHSFNVSSEDTHARRFQISVSNILPVDTRTCTTSPNCSNVLITHDVVSGIEIDRRYIEVDIVSMTMGINGYPLVIGNQTRLIFECRDSGAVQIANTGLYVPLTLAALNDGRFAVLSVTSVGIFTHSVTSVRCGVLQVFGMAGEVYAEVSDVNGEYKMDDPRGVCVNLSANDIYVADYGKSNLQLYKEDGSYVTSYSDTLGYSYQPERLFMVNYIFPLACSYDNVNHLVLASDSHGRIRVLSPFLALLGTLNYEDYFGVPVGLQSGGDGNIYTGDAITGRVRVFEMTEFSNKLTE